MSVLVVCYLDMRVLFYLFNLKFIYSFLLRCFRELDSSFLNQDLKKILTNHVRTKALTTEMTIASGTNNSPGGVINLVPVNTNNTS